MLYPALTLDITLHLLSRCGPGEKRYELKKGASILAHFSLDLLYHKECPSSFIECTSIELTREEFKQ
jgi:hypothetical protein